MKVPLVDDHALFRAGLATLLHAWGLEVIGEAGDGEEAIVKARQLRPGLVLLDIAMPRMNGLEATRAIKSNARKSRWLSSPYPATNKTFSRPSRAGRRATFRRT